MAEIEDLNVTDASNTARFPESQNPSTVNNGARALEGLIARWYSDTNGTLTTTGSANAYVLAVNMTLSAYADGQKFTFTSNFANTSSAPTLNVDAIGAKTIKGVDGAPLGIGDIQSGQHVTVEYDGTDFIMLSAPAAIGQRVLISSQTASNDASLDFTSGISSTYQVYEIDILEADVATDAVQLQLLASTDGGSTWTVTASYHVNQGTHASGTYSGNNISSGTGVQLCTDVGNAAGESASMFVRLVNPAGTSFQKSVTWTGSNLTASANERRAFGGGFFETTSAINGLQIKTSSGNLTAGTVNLYGIKK